MPGAHSACHCSNGLTVSRVERGIECLLLSSLRMSSQPTRTRSLTRNRSRVWTSFMSSFEDTNQAETTSTAPPPGIERPELPARFNNGGLSETQTPGLTAHSSNVSRMFHRHNENEHDLAEKTLPLQSIILPIHIVWWLTSCPFPNQSLQMLPRMWTN